MSEDSPWSEESESEGQSTERKTVQHQDIEPTDGNSERTEMAHLFRTIKFLVVCLYKMPIRNSGLTERSARKLSAKVSPYKQFDVLHVKDMFPRMDTLAAANLGRLVTLRRQILLYKDARSKQLDDLDSSESDRETPAPSKVARAAPHSHCLSARLRLKMERQRGNGYNLHHSL